MHQLLHQLIKPFTVRFPTKQVMFQNNVCHRLQEDYG